MGNPYPIKIQAGDKTSVVTVTGEATFTDPGNQPGGGSVEDSLYSGSGATIANGASGKLPIDTLVSGAPLLDLSDPLNPVIVAAGAYALTFYAGPQGPMSVGGGWNAALQAFTSGAVFKWQLPTQAVTFTGQNTVALLVPTTAKFDAGDVIDFQAQNLDGVQDLAFAVNTLIVVKFA